MCGVGLGLLCEETPAMNSDTHYPQPLENLSDDTHAQKPTPSPFWDSKSQKVKRTADRQRGISHNESHACTHTHTHTHPLRLSLRPPHACTHFLLPMQNKDKVSSAITCLHIESRLCPSNIHTHTLLLHKKWMDGCTTTAPTPTHTHTHTHIHTLSPESLAECRQRRKAVSFKATLAWQTEQKRNTLQKGRRDEQKDREK